MNKQKKNKQQGNGKNKSKQDLSNDYFWYQDFKCDKRMRKQANLQCRLLKDSEVRKNDTKKKNTAVDGNICVSVFF